MLESQNIAVCSAFYKSQAREEALRFAYQCAVENVFYFSSPLFDNYCRHFKLSSKVATYSRKLVGGSFENLVAIDERLSHASQRWSLSRMALTDKIVLRLACYEALYLGVPAAIVIDEAVELARRYGSQHSGGFVNGVLDKILKSELVTAGSEALQQ